MQRYLFSKVLQSIALMFGVLVIVFMLVRLTGDPVSLMINRETATQEQIDEMRVALGLDRPLLVQFGSYVTDVLKGDFGYSLRFRSEVSEVIFDAIPITFQLASFALLIAVLVAIPLGILGGTYPNSLVDGLARLVGLFGQAVPSFWLALIFIWIFAVSLGWFPSFGIDGFKSFVLPAIALAVGGMGQLVRLTRSAVLEIRNEDYIRTAKSKGLTAVNIAVRHVFRNAALALISVISIQFTYALAGSIYIESIFAIPGIGWMLNEAISNRDFVLVQSLTLFIASFVIIIQLFTDVLYAIIDPRIRFSS
ncbi:MAG: ABC transporter permease [Chloroflexi bacterium]|nr:ABC transporter permease [Chloroflexota bacterium]